MIENSLIVGAAAWIAMALACWVFLRKVTYNLLDPMVVACVSISFSASLLAVSCSAGLIAWGKFWLFSFVLCGYLVGARTVSGFFGRKGFREAIILTLARVRLAEITGILSLAVIVTLVLTIMGVEAGAAGDARQEFARVFRPLIVLQSGLFLFSVILLLSPKLSTARASVWLLSLMILSVPFSGKSVLLPMLYWYGLRLYIDQRRVTLRSTAVPIVIVLAGIAGMALFAYRASGFSDVVRILVTRLWLSGDIYLYAYQMNGLSTIHGSYPVSFIAYMMHPFTSLIGIRAYDKPLGAMLFTAVTGNDVLAGPNPHLPVLLDFFFPSATATGVAVAFAIGFLVCSLRPLGITLARSHSRYLGVGGATAAVFCPGAGFLDTSQVSISLIGVGAVTAVCVLLELVFAKPHSQGDLRRLQMRL